MRRSANELLRNKASKEAIRKKLIQAQNTPERVEDVTDIMSQSVFVSDVTPVDPSHISYMLQPSV